MPVSGVWAPPPASSEPRTSRGTRSSAAAASMRPTAPAARSPPTGQSNEPPILALSQIRGGMFSLQPNQSHIRHLRDSKIAPSSRFVREGGQARQAASSTARCREGVGLFSPIRSRQIRPCIESSASAQERLGFALSQPLSSDRPERAPPQSSPPGAGSTRMPNRSCSRISRKPASVRRS